MRCGFGEQEESLNVLGSSLPHEKLTEPLAISAASKRFCDDNRAQQPYGWIGFDAADAHHARLGLS